MFRLRRDNAARRPDRLRDEAQPVEPRAEAQPIEPLARPVYVNRDDVIDLRMLFRACLRGKWFILACAVVGVSLGLWKMVTFVPTYKASMIVAPSADSPDIPVSGPGARGGAAGVAAAFGLSFGRQTSGRFDRLRVILSSVTLAKRLQEKYGLMQKIFADSWDPQTQTWIAPDDGQGGLRARIRNWFHLPKPQAPTVQSLAGYLGSINVEVYKETTFSEVSFSHVNKEFARSFLSLAYSEADEELRTQDRARAESQKAYLRRQLNGTTLSDMRSALIGLLMREERVSMALESEQPYAAEVIEPLFVPDQPSSPKPPLYIAAGLGAGLFTGVILVALFALARGE